MSSSVPLASLPTSDDRQLFQFVFGQLSLGKKDAEIVNALVAKGVQADKAQTIVQTARVQRKTAIRSRGKRRIKIGLIAFAIGALITVGTFLAAASSVTGGVYVVSFGPILFGLYYLALGIADSMKR
ncbi:MAG TPA: hypothetical protein VGS11_12495 [Candidatus Bathyarchaeia archaeon]|nr:hypothetical protein [Candidatus Bathyarchaeia archaeon]